MPLGQKKNIGMSYRPTQRSDRDGSFPEPPCGMGRGSSVSSYYGGSSRSKRNNRLRRSFEALKCFSLWSKPGKGARDKQPAANNAFPGLDIEDSWESGAGGIMDEDFEVRTTSPPHSVDGVFDVSQALQAVPEAIEEEEESECPDTELENIEDAVSQSSKPSDYSSEFMTDDSTETSGLPWDSSFSNHGSMESPERESRIGIRPFELPPDLGRSTRLEKTLVGPEKGDNATTTQQSERKPEKRDEQDDEDSLSSSTNNDSEISTENDGNRTQVESSDNMRDVFKVFKGTRSVRKPNIQSRGELSNEMESSAKKPKHAFYAVKTPEISAKGGTTLVPSPRRKPSNRMKELMKKFEESPERTPTTPSTSCIQAPESPDWATSSSLSPFKPVTTPVTPRVQEPESPTWVPSSLSSRESFDVPTEIIRHDVCETKPFFWRSHPNTTSKAEGSEAELVDTSISNSEGNRSLDYGDVFSPEELEREYSAAGEPSFIHI